MKSSTNAAKRWWYIMPIVFITYSLAYLDRANFSFASAAGINEDLGITKGVSSLLGALFFLGYFFFQIPGAIYAERRSVRKLIFVCLILWGGCASLTGMVTNIPMLAAIRFILGVVEAAVMPAMLIYISNWFTKSERSRANTFLILGNPVTVLWMSVVSGYLIQALGWREMFIIEGVPAIIWASAGGCWSATNPLRLAGCQRTKNLPCKHSWIRNSKASKRCVTTAKPSAPVTLSCCVCNILPGVLACTVSYCGCRPSSATAGPISVWSKWAGSPPFRIWRRPSR
jgi:MFS family permease